MTTATSKFSYAKARRNMFERSITIDQANQYIRSKHAPVTQSVRTLQFVSKTFQSCADTFNTGLKNGMNSPFLFEVMVCDLRNANFWIWLSIAVAQVENYFGVNLTTDRDKIAVGNYPEELRSAARLVFHFHMCKKDGRTVYFKQPDSGYQLRYQDTILKM